ncbi:NAD(P)H-quinone oxidoreductase subunit K, chloroplastic, partial [Cucurbita argyrosperma subsp. argyrosperma]
MVLNVNAGENCLSLQDSQNVSLEILCGDRSKYVIAMGACTTTGRMFSTNSYSTVRGVDKLILVDVYLPGCPPKLEAVMDAITKLRKKISREIYEDRIKSQALGVAN